MHLTPLAAFRSTRAMKPAAARPAIVSQCPACGLPRNRWIAGGGRGYASGRRAYCCRACAEGGLCVCRQKITLHERRAHYRQPRRHL
jgi:hypothetical protein